MEKSKFFKQLKEVSVRYEQERKSSLTIREIKDILAKHGLLEDDIRIRHVIEAFEKSDGFVRTHCVMVLLFSSGFCVFFLFDCVLIFIVQCGNGFLGCSGGL